MISCHTAVQRIQLIERQKPSGLKGSALNAPGISLDLVSLTCIRLREPSIAATRKDRVLEEGVRTPFRTLTVCAPQEGIDKGNRSNAVKSKMPTLSAGGTASPPNRKSNPSVDKLTESCSTVCSLHVPRQRLRGDCRGFSTPVQPVVSDCEDFRGHINARESSPGLQQSVLPFNHHNILSEKLAVETLAILRSYP